MHSKHWYPLKPCMKNKIGFLKKRYTNKLIVFFVLLFFASCIGYKKTLYFQGVEQVLPPPNLQETYILKKRDVVQIKISNPDTESQEVLSQDTKSQISPENAYFTDYYINDSGYVELPFVGKLQLVGYTLMEADSLITKKATEYFSYPSVDVKFASFKFTALGEFEKPGQYFVSNEVCTIYEAIAIAGDAGDYSNNQKMQLIRTLDDGSKKIYRIDLTDYSSFNSDNYFIRPNDILYLQPQKAKVDKQNITNVSIALSVITLMILILSKI